MNKECKLSSDTINIIKNKGMVIMINRELYEGYRKKKMNIFEMKCLRSVSSVTKRDRITNEVKSRTRVKTEMACRVDRNVPKWLRHVERMNANCLKKKSDEYLCGR